MGFFDQYPRFYVTGHTSPVPHRLNARYAAVIDSIRDKLRSARVLGIASHDGRWSFAVLRAGAARVIGIEPRSELIDNAHNTFAEYGIDVTRCSFVRGEVGAARFIFVDDLRSRAFRMSMLSVIVAKD